MLRNGPSEQLLENPVRAEIVDQLRARPGLSFLELRDLVASALGRPPMGNGTVSHHLYHLERARLVTSRRAGRHRRFFLPQHARAAPRLAFLWDPIATRVLELVAATPGSDQTQLAQTMGTARPNLARLLTRLHKAGLVQRARMGRAIQYWPTPADGIPQPSLPESIISMVGSVACASSDLWSSASSNSFVVPPATAFPRMDPSRQENPRSSEELKVM